MCDIVHLRSKHFIPQLSTIQYQFQPNVFEKMHGKGLVCVHRVRQIPGVKRSLFTNISDAYIFKWSRGCAWVKLRTSCPTRGCRHGYPWSGIRGLGIRGYEYSFPTDGARTGPSFWDHGYPWAVLLYTYQYFYLIFYTLFELPAACHIEDLFSIGVASAV